MLTRRSCLKAGLAAVGAPFAALAPEAGAQQAGRPFGFQDVQVEAIKLSGVEFRPLPTRAPEALANIGYERYQAITFRPEAALWHDEDVLFDVQFLPVGLLYGTEIRVNAVEDGRVREVRPRSAMYDFPDPEIAAALPADLPFSGLRLHFPLNQTDARNEFMVFQGASYFRIVGRGQQYGVSARGLAVNIAGPEAEEFPDFREFWIERPAPGSGEITLYALLDGPSVAGAYRFVVRPGHESPVDVTAVVFPRRAVSSLGVAPMSSMFLMGESQPGLVDDFRPEVHDSDGLLIHSGADEWLWRPLLNPDATRIEAFEGRDPRGFGLMQRDRAFESYQDLEARYDLRPSLWVEPQSAWGEGTVELLEIPTGEEIHDNIAAYWRPARPVDAGQRLEWSYRLRSVMELRPQPQMDRVIATRSAPGGVPGARRFFVDFAGEELRLLRPGHQVVADLTASSGAIHGAVVQRNEATEGWRVFFDFVPANAEPGVIRCFLTLLGRRLTETWTCRWPAI